MSSFLAGFFKEGEEQGSQITLNIMEGTQYNFIPSCYVLKPAFVRFSLRFYIEKLTRYQGYNLNYPKALAQNLRDD